MTLAVGGTLNTNTTATRALSAGITQSMGVDEDSVLNLDLLPSRIGQAGCLLES